MFREGLFKIDEEAEKAAKKYSIIHWQTGTPKETGGYLVTTLDGEVDYDVVYKHSDGYLFWGFCANVIAWCKLSDIELYKE